MMDSAISETSMLVVSLWWALLGLFVVSYASFVWALRAHFVSPAGELPPGMKALSRWFTVIGLLHLLTFVLSPRASMIFLILSLGLWFLSLTIFWWAVRINRHQPLPVAFSDLAPQKFQNQGPYRWVRHPFYLAYSLAWLAGPLASAQFWLLLSTLFMWWKYYQMAKSEEAFLLTQPWSDTYAVYQKTTGMFLPRLFS